MMKRFLLWAFVFLTFLLSSFPLFWMLFLSFKTQGRFGLQNYSDLMASGPFARYVLNSLVVALFVVLGNVTLAAMTGYAFARKSFRGREVLFATVLGTLMIPRQATMIPVFILMTKLHLLDTYAALILPFLVDGFSILLIRQYLLSLPPDLEEAARLDGASELRVFWQVVMPLTKPALAVVAINAFLVNWNSFIYPLILTSRQAMRTLPVGLALYAQGEHSLDWGHLMSGSALSALPILVVFLLFSRQIISGLTQGAVKG